MLVNQVLADRIFIICGKTDMRKAINGLAEIVQNQYNLNPYESAAFLFCGRKADRMKCLYWDGNGFNGWKMVSINGLRQPMTILSLEIYSFQRAIRILYMGSLSYYYIHCFVRCLQWFSVYKA